jgi:hypothetical protein
MSAIDSRWEVWDNKALTSALHSYTAENFFDLEENGVTDDDISQGLWLNIQVGTAFTTLTQGWSIQVLNSDSATFATGSLADRCIAAIGSNEYPMPVAELAAGKVHSIAMPRQNLFKYLELYWKPVSAAAGAGNLDAWFGLQPLSIRKMQKFVTYG